MGRAAIILAAGKGTRMKSATPKVLHKVGGRSMMAWTTDLARQIDCDRVVIVVGPQFEDVAQAAKDLVGEDNVCVQPEQNGTAGAVQAAIPALEEFDGDAIVLYADTPLIPKDIAMGAFTALEEGASISVLGFEAENPGGYGRLIQDDEWWS